MPLYNQYALAEAALAYPQLKDGTVALLTGQAPPAGGLAAPMLGLAFAGLTLLGAGLALRSLWRLPRWVAHAARMPWWRRAAGIAGHLRRAL